MNVRRLRIPLLSGIILLALPLHSAHAYESDPWAEFGFENRTIRDKPGFHAVERLGITVGGNTIYKITHADGTLREISAGDLYQIGLGVLYRWAAVPFSAALTLNYHYSSDYNNSNSASFRRVPLEALVFFNGLGRFRIGAGIRHVYDARASATLNGVTEKFTFENTHGNVVEIGYEVRPYGWVSLRRVTETYTVASYSTTGSTQGLSGTTPFNGSHIGLFISYEY